MLSNGLIICISIGAEDEAQVFYTGVPDCSEMGKQLEINGGF
ncbi:hypothetical protein [Anoxybacillus flavithermus]|nr:hypothetical protein [Anoxybacillus flavithermus]